MPAELQIRQDIVKNYPELSGTKNIEGRSVNVEVLIAQLTARTRDEFHQLLGARHAFQARVARKQARYDFLDGGETISDPDGNRATVSAIRQGMLDGFFGRKTPNAWRVAASRPIPEDVQRPGLEGTGPCIDLGMAMGALNSGATSWMWDWEDAGGDYRDQLYQAWKNLKQILAHEWDRKPFIHPTKHDKGKPRDTALRPPRRMAHDFSPRARPAPAEPSDHGRRPGSPRHHSRARDSRPEQLRVAEEERLRHLLLHPEDRDVAGSAARRRAASRRSSRRWGSPRGTLKIKMLNERAEFALQQEVIEWVLRENLIGPNVGRWDYLNSREDMFRHDPAMVIPNPTAVTMTEPSMSYYTRRNALLALLAGAMPIGGMAAQMQNPRAPENDAKALRDIWFDKLRERLTGLIPDQRHALRHVSPELGRDRESRLRRRRAEPLVTEFDELQTVVDKLTADERERLEGLGVLEDGRVAAARVARKPISRSRSCSRRGAHAAARASARARPPKTACATRCTWRPSSCTSSSTATTPRPSTIRTPVCAS